MGILRKSGIITQSTALAMHDDNYHFPTLERYYNHMGTTDNVMSITTVGNGTAVTNAGTHSLDLSTGVNLAGKAIYSSAVAIVAATRIFDAGFLVQNIVNGSVAGSKYYTIGVMLSPGVNSVGYSFYQVNSGSWVCQTTDGFTTESTNISAVVSGDRLQIKVVQKNRVMFLVNGIEVANHASLDLTGNTIYAGAAVVASDGNTTVARTLSIDYIGFEVNP